MPVPGSQPAAEPTGYLADAADLLVAYLRGAEITVDRLVERLGATGYSALQRSDAAAVAWALKHHRPHGGNQSGPSTQGEIADDASAESAWAELDESWERLEWVIKLLMIHTPLPAGVIAAELGTELFEALHNFRVITPVAPGNRPTQAPVDLSSPEPCIVTMDLRAIEFGEPGITSLILSDADAATVSYIPNHDHVLGAGAASLSLVGAVPRRRVRSALDLGTGGGVQLVAHAASLPAVSGRGPVSRLVGTDIHHRALEYARVNFALNNVRGSLVEGSWFEPVPGEQFELLMANPPFVVGPGLIEHVYRDSGLSLDGATELVVRSAPDHILPGGLGVILGAWVHADDSDWRARISRWLPDTGVSAWVLERDRVDPATYINTWLVDEALDPRSVEYAARFEEWMDHFAQHSVEAIGMGYVYLKKLSDPDAPSELVCEEFTHAIDSHIGDEADEYFLRNAWIGDHDLDAIADSSFMVRPGVALEEVSLADPDAEEGAFVPAVIRLTRTEGPRFSHEVDHHIAAIVKGLKPEGLSLRDVTSIYAYVHDLDEEAAISQAVHAVVAMVRHGLVLPAELVDEFSI